VTVREKATLLSWAKISLDTDLRHYSSRRNYEREKGSFLDSENSENMKVLSSDVL